MRKKWRRYNTLNSVTRNGTQQQQQTMTTAGGMRRSSRSVTSSTAVYFPRFARHSAYSVQSLFTRLESVVVNCDQAAKHQQQQQPQVPASNGTCQLSSSPSKKKKKKRMMNWIHRRRLQDTMALATIKDCSAEADGSTDHHVISAPAQQMMSLSKKDSVSSTDDNSDLPQQPETCSSIWVPSTPNDSTINAG